MFLEFLFVCKIVADFSCGFCVLNGLFWVFWIEDVIRVLFASPQLDESGPLGMNLPAEPEVGSGGADGDGLSLSPQGKRRFKPPGVCRGRAFLDA